jgi:16S rRNA (cytosine967-C5)-methyltransferase
MKRSARSAALEALRAIDEQGAYLQAAVDAAAKRAGLDARDRGLALELVMGVQRWRRRLDALLAPRLRRGIESTPADLLQILRLGVYQLFYLERMPERAAVHATVDLARERGGEGAAKFVNGVLRAVQREGRGPEPTDPAVRYSHPDWLAQAFAGFLGAEEAGRLCAANNEPAPLTVRPDAPGLEREALAAEIAAEGGRVDPGRYAPEALHLHDHPGPFEGASFRAGRWVAQDEAAQLVVLLLDPRPGEAVWDACAAPGGKTRYLARRMRGEGRLWATDVHEGKVRRLAELMADHPLCEVARHDATEPPGRTFDRVLLDAPCTGLGVVRRHPEIRWRRTPEAVAEMAGVQARALRASATAVRPGGLLVYSVCSVMPAEGPAVVDAFLAEHPEFTLEPPPSGDVDWTPVLDGACVRTWPHRHGMDGFFATRLRRTEEGSS